ncbi:hypothetical protein SAMN06265371_10594 [Lutibacter agarilyticus]|uniref:Uncharacterized protein n=1 Tax=Lutibacter agarilyticus TaxID=1109740 RepID=A0A238X9W5_9FLAO|nr:hypothetical protein [Lutibacter agarilyticus]SNR55303.1 hypothetical protein SAMN06265371_10594 [Lutibacter agarilyticus]
MLQANNSVELLTKLQSEDLYVQLIQQLNKDLHLSNINFEFQETLTSLELKSLLIEFLMNLITNNYDDYLNLLYRVDVSERSLIKLASERLRDSIEQVAFLVLKREAQKVWLKQNFGK